MDNYIVMFIIDGHDPKGKELLRIKDVKANGHTMVNGFHTKVKMKAFVEEYHSGFITYKMFKQI